MIKKFDFIADPGHGWVKVPFSLLETLGITEQITRYSYQRKNFAYLEEDCDADTFFQAYKKHYGFEPTCRYRHSNKNSKIRSYRDYDKGKEPVKETIFD
jgi:hypothetical protein